MDTLKNRKQFKFYRSYFDIISELENDNDKLNYLLSILEFQFNGIELPLKGMAKFAFKSQKHSLERQLKGFIDATSNETPLNTPTDTPLRGADSIPIEHTPIAIINNKEEIVNKEDKIIKDKKEIIKSEEEILLDSIFDDCLDLQKVWNKWKEYKKDQHKFKYANAKTEITAINQFKKYSELNVSIAEEIINNSITNGYKGFFEPPKSKTTKSEADKFSLKTLME